MRPSYLIFSGLVLTVAVAFLAAFERPFPPAPDLAPGAQPVIVRVPCWFDVPRARNVDCGYFYPSGPGRTGQAESVRLAFVIIRHPAPREDVGPVLYLHGGPGYHSGIDHAQISEWWDRLVHYGWPSDVVLIDQHGSGMSRPSLKCAAFVETARMMLAEALIPAEEFAYWLRAAKQCRAESGLVVGELAFSTLAIAQDLASFMEQTGVESWNLVGVSYGTRLAMTIARHYPRHVRSLVLDSVYPPEMDDLLSTPFLYNNAIETLFQGCRDNSYCNSRFPHLRFRFFSLLDRLERNPITVELESLYGVEKLKLVINGQRLMEMLFNALYYTELVGIIPAMLDAAWRGDELALMPMAEAFAYTQLDPDFSDGAYYTIHCNDRAFVTREQYLLEVEKYPRVRKYTSQAWDLDICRYWPVTGSEARWRNSSSSLIPALFMAGEYDPVTPPEWAQEAIRYFPRGKVFEFMGIGHGVLSSEYCAAELVRDFLQNLDGARAPGCYFDLRGPNYRDKPSLE